MKLTSLLKYAAAFGLAVVATGFFVRSAQAANLLTNPGAETDDFSGWTITNGGDSGWGVNGDTNYVHSGSYSFISSYAWDTMSQEIDLIAKGYSSSTLDSQPTISIGTFEAGHWPDGNDYYRVKVELRDANHNPIASFDTGQQTSAGDHVWTEVTHSFYGYGSGVRYIYFEQDGHDAEYWSGDYGAVFDDASVTIASAGPSLAINSPGSGQTLSYDSWAPSINWGASATCEYSYGGKNYTTVDCSKNGSDIPATQTSLSPTLYILGIDASNNSSAASVTFNWTTSNTLTFGLAGYWKLDETATGTCAGGGDACDSSGSNNHGSYSGSPAPSTTVPSVIFSDPRSLGFDGSSTFITINRPVTNDLTICAWIKTATAGNGTDHWTLEPIMDAEVPTLAKDFGFGINSVGVLAYGNGGAYDTTVTGNTVVTDNRWHNACVTRSAVSGQVKLYVDGTVDGTGTTDTAALTDNAHARIGYGYDGTNPRYFNGLIDDVRAYSRVLSQSDISLLAGGHNSNDQTPPVITLQGSSQVTIVAGSVYSDAGATAIDDTDGDVTARIVATSNVNAAIAGTYTVTYSVSDLSGNAAAPVTRTVVVQAGGGGLPSVAYSLPVAPAAGFSLVINNGALVVSSPNVSLTTNGGADIKYLALSTSSDFINVGLIPYQPTVSWNMCGNGSSCQNGVYTIYAKFYTAWGQQSSVVTAAVNLQQNKVLGLSDSSSGSPAAPIIGTLTQTLRKGSRGAEVSSLQSLLAQDPSVYPEGQVTGYFGILTLRAVQHFQEKYLIAKSGSPGYGTVGPLTRAKLNSLLGQ